MTKIVPVFLETPFAGKGPTEEVKDADARFKLFYLRACMRDCVKRRESPYASHGLLTQPGVLNDDVPEERKLGIELGNIWRPRSEKTLFYVDLGMSGGMGLGLDHAREIEHPFEFRCLGRSAALEILFESFPSRDDMHENIHSVELGVFVPMIDLVGEQILSDNEIKILISRMHA